MAADGPRGGRVPLASLDAATLRDRIASGALTAEAVAEAFLAQVEAREAEVRAWAYLDGDDVLRQARALDTARRTGRALGPLHGLPVGVKDIVDTARMPTCNGTVLDSGRAPAEDAAVVARMRGAGAVIMGKTETTELAYLHPGRTRNPVNASHTPGGSSSGSAAAVASRMVPLAIGTQTGGSVIRPAAYCGCVGFKPSFGAIPRTGILRQSPSLDTVGVFAATVGDAALLAEVIFGHDAGDPATAPGPAPRLSDIAGSAPPVTPTLALVRMPGWEEAHPDMAAALDELAAALGEQCFEVPLPAIFERAAAIRQRINDAEMAHAYGHYQRRGADSLSAQVSEAMKRGAAVVAPDYIAALDWPDVLNAGLRQIFSRCDAILTASATGPAPEGLDSTGSPAFNGLWTLCGTPAVTLPLFEATNGMPMGAQLIGPPGEDARLLRTARWLAQHVDAMSGGAE